MKQKILIISLTLVVIIVFGIIFLVKYPLNNSSNINDTKIVKELEGDNAKELNYLFFPNSENGIDPSDKPIILYFAKSVEAYKFSKIELLQNGSSVSNKVKISAKDSKDNKVQILLSEYIP